MLVRLFNKNIPWQKIINGSAKRSAVASDEELWPFILLGFHRSVRKPLFIITATMESVQDLCRDLRTLDKSLEVVEYPRLKDPTRYNDPEYLDTLSRRLKVLSTIKGYEKDQSFFIISSIASIIQVASRDTLEKSVGIHLKEGTEHGRDRLLEELARSGYERVEGVFDKGEFSVRGDKLDIFNISDDNPVSIDFEYDKVSKIQGFDVQTRTNLGKFSEYDLSSCLDPWAKGNIDDKKIDLIGYIDSVVGEDNYDICVCEPMEVDLKLNSELDVLDGLEVKNGYEASLDHIMDRSYLERIDDTRAGLNIASRRIDMGKSEYFELQGLDKQKNSLGNVKYFLKNIQKDRQAGKKTIISLGDKKRLAKLKEIFTENKISYKTLKKTSHGPDLEKGITYLQGSPLVHGFESEVFSVYGELDIFTSKSPEEAAKGSSKWISEITSGSLVVHKNFGVGRYKATVSKNVDGQKKEYFLIEYAKNDKLYVPIWQADRLHRYIGEKSPNITPLGSKQWDNLKKKARNSIKRLALDLAKLYAERQTSSGHAFTEDSHWQNEMEDLFPFDETEDQIKAIDFVREKMSSKQPMDLLVCGDVGFGKTEVAIRAAFRAMLNGKQVLMLVPTTILADQHYNTFSARYEDYPVMIDVISRFKKKSEQKKIVEDFASGKLDMVIGTHRLLSRDIKANDLGLLIIDEEQRFGVNSKEKIKLLKKEVDVLTLTATPIPRTLHMALTGLRDIIQIDTSPLGRQPIETFVGKRDEFIIRMAIERELQRDGQVYYVYNRISGIDRRRKYLEGLIPNARIAVTHGRMEGDRIEKIMEDFVDKKYDILLTTSIIESGMDIGNVNTLIIEDSQRFGISQLYQLRGRVGRSSQKAYAYFLYPEKRALNQKAFERLKTLSEVTELGSGYKIALKDLELRGAGELLGPRQHGHMNAIGFDYYCQIMNEEIAKLKGIETEKDLNIQIDIPVSSYIPKSYIKEETKRIDVYRALADVREKKDLDDIKDRLVSKFGPLPAVVDNLMKIAMIKSILKKLEMERISYSKKGYFVISKRILEEGMAKKINSSNKDISYDKRTKSIYIKDNGEKIDLSLAINRLSDIIHII